MIQKNDVMLKVLSHFVLALFAILCIAPFVAIISISITSEQSIVQNGFGMIPKSVSFEAYYLLFKNPTTILRAYSVTVFVTSVGTVLALIVSTQFAYALSRKDFTLRRMLSLYLYFTMLFSGGLVPIYILITRYLGLKNSLWAIILPSLATGWNVFVLRSYLTSVPDSIIEAARIDGAGEYYTFYRIVVPIVRGGIATIGIFIALAFWNEWNGTMLYINDSRLYSLQYLLQTLLGKIAALQIAQDMGMSVATVDLPKHSLRMATCVVAIGPIVFLFLACQKNLVSGIAIGAVKE